MTSHGTTGYSASPSGPPGVEPHHVLGGRRPLAVVVLVAVTALLLVATGVLGWTSLGASSRAAAAESIAAERLQEIGVLEDRTAAAEAELTRARTELATAQEAAAGLQDQVDVWRAAGAGEAAYLNTVYRDASSYRLAGDDDLVVRLGQAACAALARGVPRDDVASVSGGSLFSPTDIAVMVTSAETFLC